MYAPHHLLSKLCTYRLSCTSCSHSENAVFMHVLQGNCLLVGVGGSGKQSLARLAAYAAGCGVFEITLTRGYDEAAFREDLKKLYTMLGAENKKMVFLFTDSHVADEGFLELINNMLTTGQHRLPALCMLCTRMSHASKTALMLSDAGCAPTTVCLQPC